MAHDLRRILPHPYIVCHRRHKYERPCPARQWVAIVARIDGRQDSFTTSLRLPLERRLFAIAQRPSDDTFKGFT
jgi:hypothetical protein